MDLKKSVIITTFTAPSFLLYDTMGFVEANKNLFDVSYFIYRTISVDKHTTRVSRLKK